MVHLRGMKLPKFVVGIDIETTGFEPETGDIIEVAAVRYPLSEAGRISNTEYRISKQNFNDKFVRICKPSRAIPEEITVLTGITNAMVVDAPPFAQVLAELQEFIGEDILLAHNASFDMKWLRYNGLNLASNKVWDTFLLATVAWPEAESYNLAALVNAQGPNPNDHSNPNALMTNGRGEHSAEYDVQMAWVVLQAAREELTASPATYKRIMELLERTGLGHYVPLFSPPSISAGRPVGGGVAPRNGAVGVEVKSKPSADPLPPAEAGRLPLGKGEKVTTARAALGPDGPLARNWPEFMPRPEQQQMAEHIETTLREGGISLIEAPTGIGKTLAYLTPLFLQKSGQAPLGAQATNTTHKAIISTYTKHLQDQLMAHDVPELQRALGTDCQVAVLKGRRNYVCTRRLGLALEKMVIPQPEAWLLIKVLRWLEQGGSGDLDRLNISHQGEGLSIHADSLTCRRVCAHSLDTLCPYQAAWRAAEAAQVLLVNHALLSDPSFMDRFPIDMIIVDEAHHLEDALRRATAVPLHSSYLQEIVSPLLAEPATDSIGLKHIQVEVQDLLTDWHALLDSLRAFTEAHTEKATLRLTPIVRRSSQWGNIEKAVEHWVGRCHFICGLLESTTDDIREELQDFSRNVSRFVLGAADRIQWIDLDRPRELIYLHDVALLITPSLQRLYGSVPAIIFTSATLTTLGTFGYIQKILGLKQAKELVLPSSFPLKENMLIYLVDDAPDPRSVNFGSYSAGQMEKLAVQLGGRTLGLFTSYVAIKTVFNLLNRTLNKAHIKLYAQGSSGGRSNMLRRFRQEPRSVLLGTDSFWEGVDIPGDSLSCVVIPKLPFSPPHDPVTEAVSAALQVDSFATMSLPQMILKLRQGIGRLIRTRDDRGVVVIFDSRLHRSRYGDGVIASLPAGRIKVGSAKDLASAVENWMGKDVLEKWNLESRI